MLGSSRRVAVLAFAGPVDLRKGYDELSALVSGNLEQDPLSGGLSLSSRSRCLSRSCDGLRAGAAARVGYGEDLRTLTSATSLLRHEPDHAIAEVLGVEGPGLVLHQAVVDEGPLAVHQIYTDPGAGSYYRCCAPPSALGFPRPSLHDDG